MGTAKNTVKRRNFKGLFDNTWWGGGRRQGRQPLSPSERCRTAMPGRILMVRGWGVVGGRAGPPVGPWPDLSAYARQPARAHVEVIGVNGLGLYGPILGLCWLEGNLGPSWGCVGPSWGYVGPSCGLCWPMLTHLEPQDPKNGNSKKHCKTRGFLRSAAKAAAPISDGHVGPAGPWPDLSAYARQPAMASLGLCWPILKALMWADLEASVGRS